MDADLRLLHRAARSVALQTATAVAVLILVLVVAVLLIDEHQQHRQADRISRAAWASADDVTDPPDQTWLIAVSRAGVRQISAGAPTAVIGLDPGTLPDGIHRTVRDGRELVIYTGNRDLGRVSAVYDLSPRELEEHRLQISLALAGLIGVTGAAGVGALIGRRAVRPLGAALALQRRFVEDASHELRTPLSVLLLRAQLLRRHLNDSATAEQTVELDRLVHDTKALGDVVTDLLLSAELHHRPQRGAAVDLAELAIDVTASFQPLARQRSVELTTDPALSPAGMNGVEAGLRRAISSLVDNAIAHTPAGGHVQVCVSSDADRVTLAVTDDGEGLDPAEAARLVERFSRNTAAGGGRRFGLGLALVDEVARAHRGTLTISGEPGAGASFVLSFPAGGGPDPAPGTPGTALGVRPG